MFNTNKKLSVINKDLKHLERFGFQKFGNFTDEDVFIIGYPKSGNTLMQNLIAHLVFGLKKDTSLSLINTCVTEFYNNSYFFRHDNRHFFKSHELPKPEYKNVIYIIRDGRDAVLSYYNMQKNLKRDIDINTLYENGGETFVGKWNNHAKAWKENKYNLNIHYVKFESLKKNKKLEIERLCSFLNIERSEKDIEDVIEATSIENMKKLEKSYSWQRLKSYKKWKEDANFVGKGMSNGFLDVKEINENSLKIFENDSDEMLKFFKYK